ncbi:MAG: hypothetical protein ACI3X4_04980 [Bacteroidaceae bacterium]
MTRFTAPFCLMLLITIMSCTSPLRKKDKDTLYQIEQVWTLSDRDLDSAIAVSKSLEGTVYTSSEYTRMKYDLLNIRIRYKRNIPASSADSIRKIVSYMEQHGTGKDKMRAYYYMGGIYDDLHDSPRAVEYALKSLEYVEFPHSCDTIIAQMCYSMLSEIYRKQRNTQEAINMALAGLRLAEQTGKTRCWYIMDVATSYNWADDKEECMEYCRKAYKKLLEEKDYRKNMPIASEMMFLFAQDGDYGKVDTLDAILKDIPEHKHSHIYHHSKGIVYEEKGELDSALAYYNKDLSISSPRERSATLSHMFLIYRYQGDYQKATECALQYQNGMRDLHRAEEQEWTRNAKGMYDYQKDKEREETLAWENDIIKFGGISAIAILLCIILVIVVLTSRHEKKMLETNANKERKLSELQETLQAKDRETQEKEKELQEQKQHSREIEEELARKKVQTEELTRLSRLTQARTEFGQAIEEIEKAARTGKGISEEKWQELLCAVDAQFPTFRATISERLPRINETLLRTCYLLKIGMSNQQIEVLTQSAHQTVWNRVKKIGEALGEESPREEEEE